VPLELLRGVLGAMEDAKTADELLEQMKQFVQQAGFETFAYALTINAPSLKPQQYLLCDYPKEWVQRYVSKGYFKVDPLIKHCENTTLPTNWEEHMSSPGDAAEFWEEARFFGLRSGLTFAVHQQPGVTGIFSIARDQPLNVNPEQLAALVGRAQMFANVLHHAISRIDLPRLLPEMNIALTPRERECLKWAADGKTAWEIGQILSIAERTAIFHLNKVIQKLAASNKTQAIVRAVALKLI
jgi:LuxR family transcriptional regulator, quorum-sensing system regulator SolR